MRGNPEYIREVKVVLVNVKSWALEPGIQLKESGSSLTIENRNPSSPDKESNNPVPGIQNPRHGIQNSRLSCIT